MLRIAGAITLTAGLISFLVVARLLDRARTTVETIRTIDLVEVSALPAPPPPPPPDTPDTPPPPPPPIKLPKLDLQLDDMATPIKATLDQNIEPLMVQADFEWETDPAPIVKPQPPVRTTPPPRPSTPPKTTPPPRPVMKSVYSAGELDSKVRLVNRPSATYPSSQLRRGVREGRVVLEVAISTSGRVSVRRVISSSHPDFSTMARSFASRARFTVPKKNGRPVTAIYRWPLILRP